MEGAQRFSATATLPGYRATSAEELLPIFARPFYREQLIENVVQRENVLAHYGVTVRWGDIASLPYLFAQLAANADYVLDTLDDGLRLAQAALLNDPSAGGEERWGWRIKVNVHARVGELMGLPELTRATVRSIRTRDAGAFMQLSGVVIGVGSQRMVPRMRTYVCTNKRCGWTFTVKVALEHDNTVRLPSTCPNPAVLANKGGKDGKRCGSSTFDEVDVTGAGGTTGMQPVGDGGVVLRSPLQTDLQEARLQERLEALAEMHSVPRTLPLVLENDLVNKLEVGMDVVVTGKLVHRLGNLRPGQRAVLEPVLLVNSVRNVGLQAAHAAPGGRRAMERLSGDFGDFWRYWKAVGRPLRGRDILVRSVCPTLHGMSVVKLATLLVLVGGCDDLRGSMGGGGEDGGVGGGEAGAFKDLMVAGEGTDAGAAAAPGSAYGGVGVGVRGFCHMLLVGDPGTGKSQLMRAMLDLIPRSLLTTGMGSTAAALTCTAVREGGGYRLEAGALVLADKGVCCIDEFATLKKEDRGCVLEAMENGTISIAKAGIVTRLPARCSVIGACNPKATAGRKGGGSGAYNWRAADLPSLTGLESPLLSRFDLVLLLPDPHDSKWDMEMSGFILSRACEGGMDVLLESLQLAEAGVEAARAAVAAWSAAAGGENIDARLATLQVAEERLAAAGEEYESSAALLRQLNEASGLGGTRYVVLGADGSLKDEDGGTVSASTVAAACRGRVDPGTPIGGILAAGSSGLADCRFPSGRRVEDLLTIEPAPHGRTPTGGKLFEAPFLEAGLDVRWDVPRMAAYIAHVKSRFPALPLCNEAAELLKRYYLQQRGADGRNASRTTIRLLQALVRLTQAHARLMYRGEALLQDAIAAVAIMEHSGSTVNSMFGEAAASSVGQTSFQAHPDASYESTEARLLRHVWGGREDGARAATAASGAAQLAHERDDAVRAGGSAGNRAAPGEEVEVEGAPVHAPDPLEARNTAGLQAPPVLPSPFTSTHKGEGPLGPPFAGAGAGAGVWGEPPSPANNWGSAFPLPSIHGHARAPMQSGTIRAFSPLVRGVGAEQAAKVARPSADAHNETFPAMDISVRAVRAEPAGAGSEGEEELLLL
jgi:DNA helicase MCM9